MPDSLPLLELFTRLRDRSRLPLGMAEYQLALKALQGGFGLQDRDALLRLCETLWTKTDEEKQQLAYHFNQLIPPDPDPVDSPEEEILLPTWRWMNATASILAALVVGTGVVVAVRHLMLQTVAPAEIEVPGAPADNPVPGNPNLPAPPPPVADEIPVELPDPPGEPAMPAWLRWVILGALALPAGLLAAWLTIYLLRRRQPQPQPRHSPDHFLKATQAIQDEVEAAKANLPSHQSPKNPFLMTGNYLPITQRQMKRSWRYLSRPVREGTPTELDVDATIQRVGQEGMFLEPVLVPPRTNRAALLLLIDHDGSMVPFHKLTERLVTTAQRGGRFGQTHVYYFHNCPVGCLYRDAICLDDEPLEVVFEQLPLRQLGALIVSDAGATRNGYNPYRVEKTREFLALLTEKVRYAAWLNPMPQERWAGTTAEEVAQMVPMFSCDRPGLDGAIDVLRGKKYAAESLAKLK